MIWKKVLCPIIGLAALCCIGMVSRLGWESKFVEIKENGNLIYHADEKGNVIPDFSKVGYHHGDKEIPDVETVIRLSPGQFEDHTDLIQKAIDRLSEKAPGLNGFRGAILMEKGTYMVHGELEIKTGGIVLRGEGDDEKGTTIVAAGEGRRTLLNIHGSGMPKEESGKRATIKDSYVPVGTYDMEVNTTSNIEVGDEVILFRPGTDQWIRDIQMDRIIERKGTRQWKASEYDLRFERTIIKIEGNRVWLDNPVMMAIDEKYGGGAIYPFSFEGRIAEVGVENIRFESEFADETDEDHGWIAIEMDKVENCWVKEVTAKYFGYACVSLGSFSKQVTVIDSKSLEPKSIITGSRRYSFNNDGQQNLFMNLYTTEGRHDFVTGAKTLGPNVFTNCVAKNTHADIGPHHRWSVGTLYDRIATDGEINVQDRGNWGSGHGWAGVTQVIWNCSAKAAAVQNPWASGKNYCIGLKGEKVKGRFSDKPDGEWEGLNQPGLAPESLYLTQLYSRLKLNNN